MTEETMLPAQENTGEQSGDATPDAPNCREMHGIRPVDKDADTRRTAFLEGFHDGIPIALGYFVVSFTLGIAAKTAGLTPLQGFLASFFNKARNSPLARPSTTVSSSASTSRMRFSASPLRAPDASRRSTTTARCPSRSLAGRAARPSASSRGTFSRCAS